MFNNNNKIEINHNGCWYNKGMKVLYLYRDGSGKQISRRWETDWWILQRQKLALKSRSCFFLMQSEIQKSY